MNKVLVTGATGFIGSYLVDELLRQGYPVRALLRPTSNPTKLATSVEQFRGDLIDPQSLTGCCDGITTLFHLGGYAHSFQEGDPTFAAKHQIINYTGTQNLFKEAARSGVTNIVYFSTVKAVADSAAYIDEEWQLEPETPYGKAKRDAEKYLLAAGLEHGIHVCILRPALVYGPGCKGNLLAMLRAIDKNYFIPVPAIANRRSMISLADICQAALLGATLPQANNKIYFVTDGIDYSTHQIYLQMRTGLNKGIPKWHLPLMGFKLLGRMGDIAEKILRRRMPFNSESIGKLFDSAAYNSQLIQHELGFRPAFDLKKCLPAMITAYRQA